MISVVRSSFYKGQRSFMQDRLIHANFCVDGSNIERLITATGVTHQRSVLKDFRKYRKEAATKSREAFTNSASRSGVTPSRWSLEAAFGVLGLALLVGVC